MVSRVCHIRRLWNAISITLYAHVVASNEFDLGWDLHSNDALKHIVHPDALKDALKNICPSPSRHIMCLMSVFIKDKIEDVLKDALKISAQLRPV